MRLRVVMNKGKNLTMLLKNNITLHVKELVKTRKMRGGLLKLDKQFKIYEHFKI